MTDATDERPRVDEVKRTSGPQTTNGRRWEMSLNGIPSAEWLALFRTAGDASAKTLPRLVEFDRATIFFKSDADQVEQWIASIDTWIAATNARYLITIEQARRQRFDRMEAETKETERIQGLNERFKNL